MKILVLLLMFPGLAVGWKNSWEFWLQTLDGTGGTQEGSGSGQGPLPDVTVKVPVPTVILKPYILKATCDRIMTLYVNGKQVAYSLSWSQLSQVQLPEGALVAIKCKGFGKSAGIFAHFIPELPEDNHWECSRTRDRNWNNNEFQSGGTWTKPVTVEHQSIVSTPNNRWFWLQQSGLSRFFSFVYCRIRLRRRVAPTQTTPSTKPSTKPNPGDIDNLGTVLKLRPTLNFIFSALYKINSKLDNLPDQITYDLKYPKLEKHEVTGNKG